MGNTENQEVVQDNKLPEISNGNGFVDLLQQEDIHDLNDPRMETKIVNNIVIVIIDGHESFSVKGRNNFDQFKHMFETQQITNTTQSELSDIQQDIELNPTDFQARIDTYKEFYKKQKSESGSKAFWLSTNANGKEKTAYKITAKEADVQIKKLEAIEQRFHQLSNPNRYKNQELARIEREVSMKQLSKELDEIWSKMPQFTEYRNDIVTGNMDTTPPFHMTINSINDAKNFSNILKKFNKQELKLDKYAADAATQQQYAQTLQSLEAYFENNLNNPNNFQPYQFSTEQLLAINYFPALKNSMGKILPEQQNTENSNTSHNNNEKVITSSGVQESFNKQINSAETAPEYTDVKDAFSRGGINGMIDYGLNKTNMNPTQKETWKSIGNMGIMIGAGVVAWNFFKNAFKLFTGKGRKDLAENGGRAWIAGPAALMFGANAWKGESISGLLNGGALSKGIADRTGDMAGKGKSAVDKAKTTATDVTKSVTETEPVTNEGLEGTSELFNGFTCPQIAELLEKDSSGKLKIKPDQYKILLNTLKQSPNDPKKVAAAKYLEKIGEKDENNMIDITLTSMGLTLEKLKEPANEKITFNEQLERVKVRIGALADLMITKYNHINPEQRWRIIDYVKNPNATQKDLTALEERGDVFEKSEEFPPDAKRIEFKTKIDTFNLKDGDKETLKNSLNSFWHLWNTDEATKNKMDIKEENGSIVLSTYGQKTKLNLQEKSIIGIENGKEKKISFGSTAELLKASNLINRIFDLVSNPGNKTNVSKDPFNISLLGRDVEYDNTKFWSSLTNTKYNHKDITVISGGIGGALKGVAPALEENKQAFVGLLNKRFNEVNNLN